MYLKDNRVDTIVDLIKKYGGGTPQGGAPFQQLVTDADGKAVWEARLAYETVERAFEPITWDGNTEGMTVIDGGDQVLVHISTQKITDPTLIDNLVFCDSETGETLAVSDFQVRPQGTSFEIQGGLVTLANDPSLGVAEGVWASLFSGNVSFVAEINPKTTTKPKTIDKKFLPEALQFGEDKAFEPIVWDGNTEGLDSIEVIAGDTYLYKMGDSCITKAEELQSVVIYMNQGGAESETTLTSDTFGENFFKPDSAGHGAFACDCVVFSDGGYIFQGITVPKGTWLAKITMTQQGIVTYPVAVNPTTTTTKPMDEKYLPTLTSPNGTKYRLTVADDGTLGTTAV